MTNFKYITDESANLVTIRDPMILVHDGMYYLTGTQPPYWKGANDGVHLWSSKDLKKYTYHGLILRRSDMPEDMWCRDRFWAPELFCGNDGYFYLTFNCRNESEEYRSGLNVGLARAKNVTGPYEIMTKQESLTGKIYGGGNDGTIFLDDDGKCYLGSTVSSRLLLSPLNLEKGTISSGITVCEKGSEGEWDSIGIEGQCIVKRHGIYFQWYSSWTNGYEAGVLTAQSINGPWVKHPENPILKDNEHWYRCGHNHSFKGLDGNDYIVFHACIRGEDETERMIILRVDYAADGSVRIISH